MTRFDDRAADYVRYRPDYPSAAIDAVLEGLALPLVAADVGAGTGISARCLADRGVRVIAVEPGDVMRGVAAPHARVEWIAGHADATGLQAASVDLVLCAQSFHWFANAASVREFARILKPGGRLALMWNRRSRTDPFTAAYREAIAEVGGESAHETEPFDRDLIAAGGVFSPVERLVFPNAQHLDFDGLLGRARSASYTPKTGDAAARLLDLLRDLHTRYADANGRVTLVYETEVFRSIRR